MTPELVSTDRPTRLRLVAFAILVGGALLLGVGTLLEWVVLSSPGDIDPAGIRATPVHGVDIWEGRVVLAAAIVILALTVVTRVVSSGGGRIAVAIAVVALAAAAIAIVATVVADIRFIATDGLDAFAEVLADDLDVPVRQVREALEQRSPGTLELDRGIGLWLTSAGGIAAAVGGVLNLRWVRRRGVSTREVQTADPR